MNEADILIIGGGIAGSSAAYHLAKLGHQVTLLERGEIASAASGVNAGMISAKGWGKKPDLQAYLGMGGIEIFKELQFDLGYDIAFRQSGSMCAICTATEYDFVRDQALAYQAAGYQVELLATREASALEPKLNPNLPGILYYPLQAQADPKLTTRAFASAAQQAGAQIMTRQEVKAILQRTDGTYRVETSQDEFAAGTLIIAAGAWSGPIGHMLGLEIPIVPVRGQMWATKPLPPISFHTISSAESWLAFDRDSGADTMTPPSLTHRKGQRFTRHLYGRQTHTGEIIFGGDRELVGYDVVPDPAGIKINHQQAAEILPFLKELPIQRTWAGSMPFSLDGAPLIGKIPQLANLFIVGGLASGGFSRGPMAGKLLADYLHTGHRPPVLAEADPARCVTFAP